MSSSPVQTGLVDKSIPIDDSSVKSSELSAVMRGHELANSAGTAGLATITANHRHRNIRIVRERNIGTPQFPEWTMSYRSMSDLSRKGLVGFEGFFAHGPISFGTCGSRSSTVPGMALRALAARTGKINTPVRVRP
jgi:hypothetical protein